MATLSDMHTQARRLVLHIRGNLDKFEGLEGAWRARDGMAGSAPDGDGWAGAVPGRPWDATSGLRPTSRGVTSHVGIEKTDKELMETEETARQQLWHLDAICRTLEGNWRQQVGAQPLHERGGRSEEGGKVPRVFAAGCVRGAESKGRVAAKGGAGAGGLRKFARGAGTCDAPGRPEARRGEAEG